MDNIARLIVAITIFMYAIVVCVPLADRSPKLKGFRAIGFGGVLCLLLTAYLVDINVVYAIGTVAVAFIAVHVQTIFYDYILHGKLHGTEHIVRWTAQIVLFTLVAYVVL